MLVLEQISYPGLSPVSFRVDASECVGLSGLSGCGKTRLLRAVADMDEHRGFASLDNDSAASMPAQVWRRRVALLPAESQWWFDTVGEHFADVETDLSPLGFTQETMGWEISRCSSGEKQRLSILRCLANRPAALLLDEPTANLDPDNALRVESLIARYIDDNQASCIWVSHNHLQLRRVAQRAFEFIDHEVCEMTL